MRKPSVVVLDYGSGNVRSAVRACERAGAAVELTAQPEKILDCDGLLVPGVGAFASVMELLRQVGAPRLIERRLAGGRPVLGICVGLQVMFEASEEKAGPQPVAGMGQWPGIVQLLPASVNPHMGWSPVRPPRGSRMFAGVECEKFYFVHSYGVLTDPGAGEGDNPLRPPLVTWAEHGSPFVAAVENGPLWATQFHPEKSGQSGARLLRNWVETLS